MIPKGLENFKQFLLWKMIDERKVPVHPYTLEICDAHDESNWVSALDALSVAKMTGLGVAFVFTSDCQRAFIDIDHCALPDGAGWSDFATAIFSRFPEAAIEISQSGEGLHIICGYQGDLPDHSCKRPDLGLELYHEKRFVALTGKGAQGDASIDYTQDLVQLIGEFLNPLPSSGPASEWTSEPDEEWDGPEDDMELLAVALASKSAIGVFGGGASFNDLFTADETALAIAYPDTGSRCYDASAADMALAAHLAFWTGKDCERMQRLMMMSSLKRDKWIDRGDYYLPRTILRACTITTRVYRKTLMQERTQAPTEATVIGNGEIAPRDGVPFMSPDEQLKYFKGCVYVIDRHEIFVPGGKLLSPDRFKATYGGYIFNKDRQNHKTTDNAWDAFIGSMAYRAPKVDSTIFRPSVTPGGIIQEESRTFVNIYWPLQVGERDGDIAPFLIHLTKLFPDQRDRDIILSYMAACVQYPGVKFQWAPLIQGVEGNGKTFLSLVVANAVGMRYSYSPRASELAERFNSWIFGRVFIFVEDVYVPHGKQDFIEKLKPMITGTVLEIEGKGTDKFTGEICCNFMLNSNHKDALRKTKNDRRFAPFYTPQQEVGDLARDGMHGDYLPKLYNWARNQHGWAIMTRFLKNYQIPTDLNPATFAMHRAPATSSTLEAIAAGLGSVEQEIMEAIDERRIGFRGGWVSSHFLDKLIENMGSARSIPRHKRRGIMQSLGYDHHPALEESRGRLDNPVMPDGCRPRLYIKMGHSDMELKTNGDVGRAYKAAQGA